METGKVTKYIYAGDERIAMIDHNNRVYYYVKDHLGSTRVLVRDDGITSAKYYRYTAYGDCKKETMSIAQPNKYTGKPLDGELGLNLYYFGARYYMANLGRWAAVDPKARDNAQWGPYTYSLSNPLRFYDPDGLDAEDAGNRAYNTYVENSDFETQIKYEQAKEWVNEEVVEPSLEKVYETADHVSNASGDVANSFGITGSALSVVPGAQPVGGPMLTIGLISDIVRTGAEFAKQVIKPQEGGFKRIIASSILNVASQKSGKIISGKHITPENAKQLQACLDLFVFKLLIYINEDQKDRQNDTATKENQK
jgi:RHS repeat-associated protein